MPRLFSFINASIEDLQIFSPELLTSTADKKFQKNYGRAPHNRGEKLGRSKKKGGSCYVVTSYGK
jgi:hypothetical protein